MKDLLKIPMRIGVAVSVTLMYAPAMPAQALTASQILDKVAAKNSERLAALGHYSGDRVYHIEYDGIGGHHMAELTVHAEYTAPGRKRFTVVSERGSKPICREVLMKLVHSEEEASDEANQGQTPLTSANYDAKLVGKETVDGIDAWVLDVTPKVATKFDYEGRIWVSADDFGIVRVAGSPAKSPSWIVRGASFDYRYQRVGIFWLPEKNVSVSHVRMGGDARLTISYGAYSVEALQPRAVQTAKLSASMKSAGMK